jgi:hypothetical protein
MSELFEFLELYVGASNVVKDMVFLYFLITVWHYFELTSEKKETAFYNTIDFAESCIEQVVRTAKENIRVSTRAVGGLEIEKEIRRYDDRIRLGSFRVKNKLERFIRINGYYKMYTDKDPNRLEANRKKLETMIRVRGLELKAEILESVEPCFRPESPFYGLVKEIFSDDDVVELYRLVVSRHVDEIRIEERDINHFLLWRVPFLRLIIKYKHKDLKVR